MKIAGRFSFLSQNPGKKGDGREYVRLYDLTPGQGGQFQFSHQGHFEANPGEVVVMEGEFRPGESRGSMYLSMVSGTLVRENAGAAAAKRSG